MADAFTEAEEMTPVRADAEMLRRAANACRNIQKQAVGPREWFDWVPKHLEWLAAHIDGEAGG